MKAKQRLKWARTVLVFGVLLSLAGCGVADQSKNQRDTRSRESWSTTKAPSSGGRYDLSGDEQRGGHTLRKHVGRTDEELRQRLEQERDISAASTWTDRAAAEETVGEALRVQRDRIQSWQARGYPRANFALHFDAGKVIGRSMRHGDGQASPCTRAVIVLKADGEDSFYVLTTYPEARP